MPEQPEGPPEEAGPDEEGTDPGAGDDRPADHLRDVEPGAGCTEIWEHLSERREE